MESSDERDAAVARDIPLHEYCLPCDRTARCSVESIVAVESQRLHVKCTCAREGGRRGGSVGLLRFYSTRANSITPRWPLPLPNRSFVFYPISLGVPAERYSCRLAMSSGLAALVLDINAFAHVKRAFMSVMEELSPPGFAAQPASCSLLAYDWLEIDLSTLSLAGNAQTAPLAEPKMCASLPPDGHCGKMEALLAD